jgi:hypothetical protein
VSSQKTNELCIRIRQLHDTHCEAALNSGNWCLLAAHDEDTGLSISLFLGDRGFRLNGYIDSQNNSFPVSIHEMSLLDITVGAWCAMSVTRITGLVLSNTTRLLR